MRKILKLFKSNLFWIVLIVVIGFAARLYKIDTPLADWHSWRQADTAAVSRNFYKDGYNPLMPKYDDMSGVAESPNPNPRRLRFVEFPIYNSIVYFVYLLNGGVDIKLARFVSIIFSLGSVVFIYLITKRYFDNLTSMVASLLFAILPFNVFFSRVVLPEPTLVFFCLGMFYFTDLWINKNTKGLFFTSVFFAICAFLLKPTAIFYLLPLLYVYIKKEGKIWPIPGRFGLWISLAAIPFLAWRFWIQQFPEGIPASNWLLNGTHIRFRPAFFRWIIGDRFGREILSVTGTFLFFLGFLLKPKDKEGLILHLLCLSSFLYLVVFATGNVTHDYYQTLIVPALVIFTARGFTALLKGIPVFLPRLVTIPVAFFLFILTIYLSFYEVKGLYQINNGVIVEAGEAADRILSKDAIVVAPYQGDTTFLYHTNRPGWANVSFPTQDLIDRFGVTNYVSVNYDDKTNWLKQKYEIIEANPKFIILDLTRENPNFYLDHITAEELKEPF